MKIIEMIERSDAGFVSLLQAIKTLLVLGLTFAVVWSAPPGVRVITLICTAFAMQSRSGATRVVQWKVMTSCTVAIVGLVALGSAVSGRPIVSQLLLPVVAFFSFASRRYLPAPSTYTVFIFICFLLSAVFPNGSEEFFARVGGVAAGGAISIAVTFLLPLSLPLEGAFYRGMAHFLDRAAQFHAWLAEGAGNRSRRNYDEQLDRDYDQLLSRIIFCHEVVAQLPDRARAKFERLLLTQFDLLHSLYMLRRLKESPGAEARRQMHEDRRRETVEQLEAAARQCGVRG